MKNKSGFTLIEVALVLGIAGLIFTMTFLVLPNLWASERDSERREDMMTFVTNLKNFQTNNNRGALPGSTGEDRNKLDNYSVIYVPKDDSAEIVFGETDGTSWEDFYKGYFNDQFMDPDGHQYRLQIMMCEAAMSKLNQGNKCDASNLSYLEDTFKNNMYTIYVVVGASCDGDFAVKSTNGRKVAVLYKLERSGQFCYNS